MVELALDNQKTYLVKWLGQESIIGTWNDIDLAEFWLVVPELGCLKLLQPTYNTKELSSLPTTAPSSWIGWLIEPRNLLYSKVATQSLPLGLILDTRQWQIQWLIAHCGDTA